MEIDLDKPVTKKIKDVKVRGKAVSVRRLSLLGTAHMANIQEFGNVPAKDIAGIVVDGLVFTNTGKPVYTQDQIDEVANKDGAVLSSIFNEIASLYKNDTKAASKN